MKHDRVMFAKQQEIIKFNAERKQVNDGKRSG